MVLYASTIWNVQCPGMTLRPTIAAGTLPREPETIARFVAAPDLVKPGVLMPGFAMLPPDELATLAAWLDGLR